MRKLLIILGVVVVLVAGFLVSMRMYTKSHSPLDIAEFQTEDISLSVKYCQPYKKDRAVFGQLVPFNTVWRTGANEATTINVGKDIYVQGQLLPAGDYSLWTIPGKTEWQVMFNKEIGQWGVKIPSGEANYDPSLDQLVVKVSSYPHKKIIEQFTIQFEKMDDEIELIMMWDDTLVVIPFTANP